MADTPTSPVLPAKPPVPRRCAKCALPAKESAFKNDDGEFTPYCAPCRGRFPSLSAPRFVLARPRKQSRR